MDSGWIGPSFAPSRSSLGEEEGEGGGARHGNAIAIIAACDYQGEARTFTAFPPRIAAEVRQRDAQVSAAYLWERVVHRVNSPFARAVPLFAEILPRVEGIEGEGRREKVGGR